MRRTPGRPGSSPRREAAAASSARRSRGGAAQVDLGEERVGQRPAHRGAVGVVAAVLVEPGLGDPHPGGEPVAARAPRVLGQAGHRDAERQRRGARAGGPLAAPGRPRSPGRRAGGGARSGAGLRRRSSGGARATTSAQLPAVLRPPASGEDDPVARAGERHVEEAAGLGRLGRRRRGPEPRRGGGLLGAVPVPGACGTATLPRSSRTGRRCAAGGRAASSGTKTTGHSSPFAWCTVRSETASAAPPSASGSRGGRSAILRSRSARSAGVAPRSASRRARATRLAEVPGAPLAVRAGQQRRLEVEPPDRELQELADVEPAPRRAQLPPGGEEAPQARPLALRGRDAAGAVEPVRRLRRLDADEAGEPGLAPAPRATRRRGRRAGSAAAPPRPPRLPAPRSRAHSSPRSRTSDAWKNPPPRATRTGSPASRSARSKVPTWVSRRKRTASSPGRLPAATSSAARAATPCASRRRRSSPDPAGPVLEQLGGRDVAVLPGGSEPVLRAEGNAERAGVGAQHRVHEVDDAGRGAVVLPEVNHLPASGSRAAR